jgi:hypothetical protein
MSDEGPTGTIEETGPVGETGITGETGMTGESGIIHLDDPGDGIILEPEPPRITLSELMSDISIVQQQEADDGAKFSAVNSPDLQMFRTKLLRWAAGGFKGFCDLVTIPISAPNMCSDGIVRNLFEYIHFVSGKTYLEHMQTLQAILPDFLVVYRCSRTEFVLCVSKS